MAFTRDVIVAQEDSTAVEIARLMVENDIGSVVIMRGEVLAGIVSERDLARRVLAKDLPGSTKASCYMTKDLVTTELKEGIDKIYQILCSSHFRHLPILENGKLVGIASQRDVLYSPIAKTAIT
ncbi:MAG: CBS domain-containing protein [Candidatus Moraniibacteriota bacterium]